MPNPENLIGKGFDARPENIVAGRPKGSKNRSTLLKEILALTSKKTGRTKEYQMNHAIIKKAISGDVSAFKEIQDTLYGKIPDKVLNAETSPQELERDVTDEILKHVPTEVLEGHLKNEDNNG